MFIIQVYSVLSKQILCLQPSLISGHKSLSFRVKKKKKKNLILTAF